MHIFSSLHDFNLRREVSIGVRVMVALGHLVQMVKVRYKILVSQTKMSLSSHNVEIQLGDFNSSLNVRMSTCVKVKIR